MWEIYAYHNSDSLFGIFNAVAAIMAAGSYMGSIAAVAFCGFVTALLAYAFAPQKLQGWQWLGSVVLVYSILFLPRVSVQIIDKTGGSPVQVVDNVPFGMAAVGGLTSVIGNSTTELFETAFTVIPGRGGLSTDFTYQQNGLMFGSRLIQQTRSVSFLDPTVKADLMNFISNCTAFDIADGAIGPDVFSTSADIWSLMSNTNPARFTTLTSSGGITTETCDLAYASINSRIPGQVTAMRNLLASTLNPTLPTGAAQALIDNQVYQAYIRSQIAAASATAADLIRQNAMVNAVNDAAKMGCQKVSDPSCMMLATAQANAVAQQNAAWINGAKIAGQALPIVRNVAEALTYAIFPLLVLMLFLTSGRGTLTLLQGYVAVLVSIQLWPPLFAILNYMSTIYYQSDMASAAAVSSGSTALSLSTASTIYSSAISGQAVVSYLIVAIPPLAWALANKMANFGVALTGGLSSLQSTTAAASAAAASGNVNMGNVTMDQRNVSPSTSSPFVRSEQAITGDKLTFDGTGRTALSVLRNEGIESNVVTAKTSLSDVQEAQKSVDAAATRALNAGESRAAVLSNVQNRLRSAASSSRGSSGNSASGYQEISQASERLSSEAKRISALTGVGENQVATALLKLSLLPSAAGIGGGGTLAKDFSAKLTQDENKVLDHANAETFKIARQFGDRVSHDKSFIQAIATEERDARTLASSLAETTSRAETEERRYSSSLKVAESRRLSYESGQAISWDIAKDPAYVQELMKHGQVATEYGASNPQSMGAYFGSQLGNYSRQPSTFTDGSAVPTSFSDVERANNEQRRDTAVNPTVGRVKLQNDSAVSRTNVGKPQVPGSTPDVPRSIEQVGSRNTELRDPSSVPATVQENGEHLSSAAGHRYDTFNKSHGLTHAPGKPVTSERSLVLKATDAMKTDVLDTVKAGSDELAKPLLEKLRSEATPVRTPTKQPPDKTRPHR